MQLNHEIVSDICVSPVYCLTFLAFQLMIISAYAEIFFLLLEFLIYHAKKNNLKMLVKIVDVATFLSFITLEFHIFNSILSTELSLLSRKKQ
jgi:hypothetical protein